MTRSLSLERQVAVVAGATRGAGRAIAVELAAAGATVYVTGRSTRRQASELQRPETIEETAALIESAGGRAHAVQVDHLEADQVRALAARVDKEQAGRLDIVVNDIWGGDDLTGPWDRPFWEHALTNGLRMHRLGFDTHLLTSWHLAPLLVAGGRGLIVEITDGVDEDYRGNLFYDLVKAAVIRLALGENADLANHGGMAVAVTPGFLRSEAMLDRFGVTEANWRDAIAGDVHFRMSETPAYVGRAVAAIAGDPQRQHWAGKAVASWEMARHYGFTDTDGSQPDWGRYFRDVVLGGEPYTDSYRLPAGAAGAV
jgi:NAD(P)-dependent dehydrogenase (short-subunit alcohol dehydrogenase family)